MAYNIQLGLFLLIFFSHVIPNHSPHLSLDLVTLSFFLFLECAKFIPPVFFWICSLCLEHWIDEYLLPVNLSSMLFPISVQRWDVSYPQANLLLLLHFSAHSRALISSQHLITFWNDNDYDFNCFSLSLLSTVSSMRVGGLVCVVCCCIYAAYDGAWPTVRWSIHI